MKTYNLNNKEIFPLISNEKDTFSFSLQIDDEIMNNAWLCFDISIAGGDDSKVSLEWAENSSSETAIYMFHTVIPNCDATISFPIAEKNFSLHSVFLPPYGALRKGIINGKPISKEKVRFVRVQITSESLDTVLIKNIFFSKERPDGNMSGEPVLDALGQRIVGDWKNKTKNEQELEEYLKNELVKSQDAEYPTGWSSWGGWTGIKSEATGFFRIEKINNRWWLIDPDGYAFFSNGVCYAERAGVFGFTEEYRKLHAWLPSKDGEFAEAWCTADNIPQYLVRNGEEGAKDIEMFSFGRANLIKVFGKDWYSAYTKITSSRMRRMGFNTVCVGTNDYFDEQTEYFLKEAKIPYVVTFKDFPLTKERIFGDFPDVFSEEYKELCREFAERSLRKYSNDPYLIGYFVTNEPEWLFATQVNLAQQLLVNDGCLASKKAFVSYISKKYKGLNELNTSWNTEFNNFEDILPYCAQNNKLTSDAQEDINKFECVLIKQYASTVSNALREVDSVHLNLGMRYAYYSEKTVSLDLNHFDVFSINCYQTEPKSKTDCISKCHDMPIIIGEWHFGAKECGLPAFGLLYTDTQEKRAAACTYYSEVATQVPNIIGIHYFEYNDQPYFGRFDGECYQIGLFDVCHKPYVEVYKAYETFAKNLYPLLEGQITMQENSEPNLK